MRAVLHLDMDAFFAAVEIRDRPELEGTPVVVGADPREGRGRGVVSTCNYPAREHGIGSGMPISEAYERCPEATYIPVDGPRYAAVSDRIMADIEPSGDRFEQTSIDEAYIGLQDIDTFQEAVRTARRIRGRIDDRFDLTCSIGVATNRTVAKIASDADKPDGLTVVRPGEAADFLADRDIAVIPGVGDRTEERLREMDVATAGELADISLERLGSVFGDHGRSIGRKARGIDPRPVGRSSERKSLGTETTFQEDMGSVRGLENHIRIMAQEIARQLDRRGLCFRTVELKLRRSDFETSTRQRTLPSSFRSQTTLARIGTELLEVEEGEQYRLIGLRAKNLQRYTIRQTRLSEFPA